MHSNTNTAAGSAQAMHGRYARLSGRAFAVFGVSLSFTLMLTSGLILYLAPSGRIANTLDWSLAGLGRPGWEALHMATAVIFTAFVAWHFIVHLRVFGTLLGGTPVHPAGHRREALIALAAVALVALAAILSWPPASWVSDGNTYFKQSFWGAGDTAQPVRGPGYGRGRQAW